MLEVLTNELEEMRGKLIEVIMEIQDIELQQNPRIEMEWQTKVGCWVLKAQEADLAARRAKRKLALLQAAINVGKEADESLVELALDKEFEAWSMQVAATQNAYERALERRKARTALSAQDAAELKRLHRILVKRLHPDVAGELRGFAQRAFELMQAAYEAGDVEMLRSLEVSTQDLERADDVITNVDELNAEIALCEAQLTVEQEHLENLKNDKPYSLKDKLNNPDWLSETITPLKEQIKECTKIKEAYDQRIEAIRRGA